MEQYLIDTSIVSDYFASVLSNKGMLFMDEVIDAVPNLSIITQIELLCWKTNESTEVHIKSFISDSNVLNITPEIIEQCVELRKSRKIKTPDAIIAATALANNYIVITNNEKDFANIKGLKLISPRNL